MSARRRGSSPTLINDALLRQWALPKTNPQLGKEARGDVLVVGGSAEIPGAVQLAATAALRAGAGRVQIATAGSVALHMAVAFPEARVIGLPEGRDGELGPGCSAALHAEIDACSALLVGPGMRKSAAELLTYCRKAKTSCPLIVDAGGLHGLQGRKPALLGYAAGIVATPHAGEMANLWGCERERVQAQPLELALEAAATLGVILVLKGAETFIVAPDGTAFRNLAGNHGLATAGSGDALSGVIAGLIARGAEPLQAAVWGVYLHAKAGEVLARKVGPMGFLARELPGEIPRLLGALCR